MAIPRRNKETALFNPDKSVEGASRTATRYLAKADQTGVMVHPEGDETTGWKISSAIELLKSGVSYIKLWLEGNPAVAKIRLGLESAGHAIFSPSGMEVFTDSTTSVAKFGDDVRLGTTGGYNMELDGDNGYIALKHGSNRIISLTKYINTDDGGSLNFGSSTSVHGSNNDTFVSCSLTSGNTGVADSRASNVYAQISAQTDTKYNSFRIKAEGLATLSCGLFVDGALELSGTGIHNPSNIEFMPSSATANNGGYIDFHYNQSTANYTSRIIESASGKLNLVASNGIAFNGEALPVANGGTGQTSSLAAARALGLAKTKGDSFTVYSVNASGYLTSSRKTAVVTVPVPFMIYGTTSTTSCTLSGTFTARQNNGYCFGSTASAGVALSTVTVTIYRIQSGYVTFTITGVEQTSAINNDPISVYFSSLTVTLT